MSWVDRIKKAGIVWFDVITVCFVEYFTKTEVSLLMFVCEFFTRIPDMYPLVSSN